ncbi:MAG TPA: hypothetical protein VIU14_13755 [Mesorhizobium sp.]|jgi:hypothetical protein
MRKLLAQYVLPTVILALLIQPASAGLADGAQANLKAASAQFEALLKEDAARAAPPRLTDEKAKPVFGVLFDDAKILGSHPYTSAEVEPLLTVFGAYFGMTKSYLGFRNAQGTNNIADNEFEYQNELSKLAEEMVKTSGALAEALDNYVRTTPADQISEERKGGLARMRTGVSQVVSGVITLLQNPRYSAENKIVMAGAIVDTAPYLRQILRVEDRKAFAKSALDSLLNSPKEVEPLINEFSNTMNSEDCINLCALK